MKDQKLCTNVIAFFEGFEPNAKWDVNAWRLGFGSDTKGADQTKVRKGDTTTLQEAKDNLQARLPEFEAIVLEEIGAEAWGKFAPNGQAALMSFCYNYGELTPTLESFAAQADVGNCALAIQEREVDNGGVNAKRRAAEACLMASTE
jgi:GH24 family phage-related lysozyme (muramidase)